MQTDKELYELQKQYAMFYKKLQNSRGIKLSHKNKRRNKYFG
jgi:hypothetical protein